MVMRGFNSPEGHSAISAVVIGALLAGTVAAATAPVIDWETPRPTSRTDTGDYSPYVNPQFTSARSLSETTSWLKTALEKYGDVPSGKYDPENSFHLSGIKFQDCSMRWLEHRLIDDNKAAIDNLYTLQLGVYRASARLCDACLVSIAAMPASITGHGLETRR
jgi:hypothetical protein